MTDTGNITEAELIALHSGEPSAMGDADLQRRIAADPEAQALLAEWRRQDGLLADLFGPVAVEPIPDRLRDVLRRADRVWPDRTFRRAAIACALVLSGLMGWWLGKSSTPDLAAVMLASAAQQAHATYVVEVVHPIEVAASDSKHLTTWLSKRVDRSLNLPDFFSFGFNLLGGRVVPSDKGPAALLMYEDDKGRRITLFIENGGNQESAMLYTAGDQTGTFSWVDEGLGCALTGDLPRDALRDIAMSAYEQLI
ncbi:MAG: hypothetical protein DI533_08440 [Cereibacter sphaeroides]|uniref:Anti-sigma factor n=1 Tax=Cereibacter sphaeroides TaxID=1063 RepID=A0A2W5SFC6_CERSP|nr:MAG: hypothetical protein DI533_08440 [Cereibacter sphaeroides]